jgi:hypothetical protein
LRAAGWRGSTDIGDLSAETMPVGPVSRASRSTLSCREQSSVIPRRR